ncbi:hypothetical protein BD413DRAFT_226375 [Trametes elegans]|nr:hypothetical protein BD413DRAFT_226375 [Trametes elegans]
MPAHEDHHRDVLSLRLALGSILSPKRTTPTQSSATSGTASPALHCPHAAIPITPSASSSSSHRSIHSSHTTPHVPHSHPHPAVEGSHPQLPDAAVSTPAVAPAAASGGVSGSATPGGRTNIIGTLQSKNRWDVLVHGSWV